MTTTTRNDRRIKSLTDRRTRLYSTMLRQIECGEAIERSQTDEMNEINEELIELGAIPGITL